MRRVLLAGSVADVAVLAPAGVAEAGSLDTGGDAKDTGHHKKHREHEKQQDDSDDSDCSGCGGARENEPADYCEECAESCSDFALSGIPGFGSVPVVGPSEFGLRRLGR